jgi:hypothetical protein
MLKDVTSDHILFPFEFVKAKILINSLWGCSCGKEKFLLIKKEHKSWRGVFTANTFR